MHFADMTDYLSSQFHRDPYLYAEPSSFPGVVDRSTSYAVPSSSNAVPTGSGVSEPFILKRLNGWIKVCAGCKGHHVKSADNGLLFPPFDICLGHKEKPLAMLLIKAVLDKHYFFELTSGHVTSFR